MLKTLLFTAIAFLALTQAAKADHLANQGFLQIIDSLEKAETQAVFDRAERLSVLSTNEVSQLSGIAREQAQIWGDTILEGDYQADGRTVLDHVDALTIDGQLVAYRITYSERSWDTSSCSYSANTTSLEGCLEGRIVEDSFVAPDFKSWTRDMNALAAFVN